MGNKTPAAETAARRGSLQERLLAQIGQNQQGAPAATAGPEGDKFAAARQLEARTVQAAIAAGSPQDAALLQGHPIASLREPAAAAAAPATDAAPVLPRYRPGMALQVGMRLEVALDDLQDSPVQPRVFVNAERLQEMKASLAENGQLQHAQVLMPRAGETRLTLREGHTRRRLLRELGRQAMNVEVVAPGRSEEDEAVLAREVNHRRSEITVYDIAVRLCQFLDRHRAENREPPPGEVLARRFGLSSGSRVSEYMAIGRLPEGLLQQLFDGNVGRGSAYQVALVFKRQGHKEALKLANRLTRVRKGPELAQADGGDGAAAAGQQAAAHRQKTLALAMVDGPFKGGVKLMTSGELVLKLKPNRAGDGAGAAIHARLLQVLREAGMEVTAAATEPGAE